MGTSSLVPSSVSIRRVVSQNGNRAIAETTVELAFQFERDSEGSPWRIASVRLGDQNWVSVAELITALNETRRKTTAASMEKLVAGVAAYRQRNNGTVPTATNIQDLADILHPQYMSDLVLEDAWGRQIQVESSTSGLRFHSLGADGRRDTPDDVVFPQ